MSIKTFAGQLIAPGHGVGILRVTTAPGRGYPASVPGVTDPSLESERFRQEVKALEFEIEEAAGRLEADTLRDEAEILRVHLAMLRDPELHNQVLDLIHESRHRAETAVEQVLGTMAAMIACANDPMLAERAADFRDLALRLQVRLGDPAAFDIVSLPADKGAVIIALPELLPSFVLEARESGVAGFVVESGTSVSHGAILAKSFGIPAVRISTLGSLGPFEGRQVFVGGTGEILVDPKELEVDARRPIVEAVPIERISGAPATRVWVSIVDPQQLETIDWTGIEGVGLYRSEALFMRHHEDFPSEEKQIAVYRRLFELAGERPVVFRTADLGADKSVDYMHFGPEENPCLGLRAHRLFRFHPEIFVTQVRAVLQAAYGRHQLRLLFPMIESIEQLHFIQGLVSRATQSLTEQGLAFQRDFLQGVLIETPSAAWSFGRLLQAVDFVSIGTNDFVQYLFAVERNSANVADLYQPEHPIVLQIIGSLAAESAAVGKPFSICGEIAADPSLLPVLVGLGVADLSVAMGACDDVRRRLAELDEGWCRHIADWCVQADTVDDVRVAIGWSPEDVDDQVEMGEGDALDPVCGMVVRVNDTPHVLRADGVVHYFCSRACLKHFISGKSSTH
jgi:phosphoenolpyruvate-protein phosphotransferase